LRAPRAPYQTRHPNLFQGPLFSRNRARGCTMMLKQVQHDEKRWVWFGRTGSSGEAGPGDFRPGGIGMAPPL
jgi:hypothetical protein